MQPYGAVADRGALDLPPSKERARQGARREVAAEIESAARDAAFPFDVCDDGLIAHCATCDAKSCCCECEVPRC